MTDREKLIELVAAFCRGLSVTDITPPYGYENMADYLLANGVVVRKWIPVTERLPKDGRYLICKDFGGTRYVGVATYAEDLYQLDKYDFYDYRRKKKGGFVDFGSDRYYELTNVTHWMPLPELPTADMRKGDNG